MFGANPKNPQSEFMVSKKNIAEYVGRGSYKHTGSIKQRMTDLNRYKIPGNGVTMLCEEGSVARMEEEMKTKLHAKQKRELQDSMSKDHNTA